ncbi:MAG: nucleoside deaminase [Bacteroidota bacterium]|nr:nucleoside deaminase [Bacteroidota bacterium]|tara:strand:+ start:241 stop:690 length:450 start_codon:yes stop_codon:yes gene_type:complete
MSILKNNDEFFMKIALKEAMVAYDEEEIPVGAVIVHNNKVISKGHNQCQKLNDSTAHAEMIAITSAQNKIGSKYLNECEMYVTLEPCMMCSGAIHLSKIRKVVYGLDDKEKGYLRKSKEELNKKLVIVSNVLEAESREILESFFFKLRS